VEVSDHISVYDMERDIWQRLTTEVAWGPVWTPDGKRLAYVKPRPEDGQLNIWWRKADGTGEERLTAGARGQFADSWSPDGHYLALSQNPGDVFVLDLEDGRKLRCVACSDRYEWGPVFSRDSKWLAYLGMESGRSQVYARPLDGSSGEVQITNDGEQPLWSPTGKELFYWQSTVMGMRMMAVDISLGPRLSIGKPHLLFEGRYRPGGRADYAVTDDGQQFLMLQKVEQPTNQLQLVVNWFEELRARVRPSGK